MIPILETVMMTNIFFCIQLKVLAVFWERGLNSELIGTVRKVSGRREGGGEEVISLPSSEYLGKQSGKLI